MKKLLAILIITCLSIQLAACGGLKETSGASGKDMVPANTETAVAESDTGEQSKEGDSTEGTGKQSEESGSAGSTQENGENKLEIYYVSDDMSSAKIISAYRREHPEVAMEAVSFNEVEKMDTQIATVASSGKGPDVILFPADTTLDSAKMSMGDTFMDLTAMLEADADFAVENYYPVLEAGQVDGRQTLMPLRFQLHYFMTTEEKAESFLALPEQYTIEELFQAFHADAAAAGEDRGSMHIMSRQSYAGMLYDNLRLTGVDIVDLEKAEYTVEDDLFREYAEFSQVMNLDFAKSMEISQNYSRDFIGGFSKLTAYWFTDSLPYNMRYYASIMREGVDQTMKILPYPNRDKPDTVTADISLYAAVLQSTDMPEQAYEFVRFAMDLPMQSQKLDLSVNKSVVQTLLDEVEAGAGGSISIGAFRVTIQKLTPEYRAECEALLNSISAGSIRNGALEAIMTETLEAYIRGEAEFEACYQKFKNQVSIYLYE